MVLLNKAKEIVKKSKKSKNEAKKLSPMDELLQDPEVVKTARYLVKHMNMSQAREVLNQLLEEEERLPRRKNGEIVKITYLRFKTLLPKKRKKKQYL